MASRITFGGLLSVCFRLVPSCWFGGPSPQILRFDVCSRVRVLWLQGEPVVASFQSVSDLFRAVGSVDQVHKF